MVTNQGDTEPSNVCGSGDKVWGPDLEFPFVRGSSDYAWEKSSSHGGRIKEPQYIQSGAGPSMEGTPKQAK